MYEEKNKKNRSLEKKTWSTETDNKFLDLYTSIKKHNYIYLKTSHIQEKETIGEGLFLIIPVRGLLASSFPSILSINVTCAWFLVG